MPAGRRVLVICSLAAALSGWSGCGGRRSEPVAAAEGGGSVAAVSAVLGDLDTARSEGDLETLLARFDRKVLVLPPGDELLEGAAMVRTWLEAAPNRLCPLRAAADATAEISGDWAYLTWSEARPETVDGGEATQLRILVVLRRDPASGWVVQRLVWNTGPSSTEESRG